MSMIRVKRVYEAPDSGDGERILVDRMWPRGLSRKRAAVDLWLRDLAPNNELRRSFGHNPARWADLRSSTTLQTSSRALEAIEAYTRGEVVTLLFAERAEDHNNAVALREYLDKWLKHEFASNHERSTFPFDGLEDRML
jgi:uncharacterized protein YeaO (DUF488 family)